METVERVAEVVLYEGYLLYPYTRSTLKNQQRWTFGGVYPPRYSAATGGHDPSFMQTQCLVLGSPHTELEIKVRFLHVLDRQVVDSSGGTPRLVEELRVGDRVYRPWEESAERQLLMGPLRLEDLLKCGRSFAVDIPAGAEEEPLLDAGGAKMGSLVRAWQSLQGEVELGAERLPEQCYRLTIRIASTTPWPGEEGEQASRSEALRRTMISTHTILRVRGGELVSLLEPPDRYAGAAAACDNVKTWPVLAGEPGERHTILSSPIILYDYPQIAPESPGNLFDATEIDELLTLSVMTLTDEEKREIRESDPKGREILERTEALTPEQLLNLHGTIRSLQALRGEEP